MMRVLFPRLWRKPFQHGGVPHGSSGYNTFWKYFVCGPGSAVSLNAISANHGPLWASFASGVASIVNEAVSRDYDNREVHPRGVEFYGWMIVWFLVLQITYGKSLSCEIYYESERTAATFPSFVLSPLCDFSVLLYYFFSVVIVFV